MNNLLNRRLKIGVYNPYFDMLGGGEKYIATVANILAKKHEVTIFSSQDIRSMINNIFQIDLSKTKFSSSKIFEKRGFFRKLLLTEKFDLFFYMTDGSIFFPLAKKNFLIIQSPGHIPKLSILNRIKIKKWKIFFRM